MIGESLQPVSIYFHIPLCTRKCDYCHFYVIPNKEYYHEILLQGLLQEWSNSLPLLDGKRILSLYFGGGTPSLFPITHFQILFDKIQETHSLADIEITLEANPEKLNYTLIKQYYALGVNRLSLGVQSFDDSQLTLLTRQHDSKRAIETIEACHAAGITNISIDLMYDLPDQNLSSWQKSLDLAGKLPITHLSLYNLTFEPTTVFYKNRERLLPRLSQESTKMYQMAVSTLEREGLKQYEISAFARDGKVSIHNTGYWGGRPFLGLGPSAFSYWQGARYRKISNLHRWARAVENGEEGVDYREKLDKPASVRELFCVGIRLLEGVSGVPEGLEQGVEKLVQEGFLEWKQTGKIALTKKGILFYDTVAEELI